MEVNEIIIKYFGIGFEREENPFSEAYVKLVDLLYDLSGLGVIEDVEEIIRELDNISSENALHDENGEVIYNASEIDERKAYLSLLEDGVPDTDDVNELKIEVLT